MKPSFFVVLCLFISFQGTTQTNCAVAGIDPILLKKANSVVRKYELRFEVLNRGEAVQTEHKIITLLNAQASDELEQDFWYDRITKIKDMDGAVYDSQGKLVRNIHKSDIQDFKPLEYNFVDDNRIKRIKFPRLGYPYTIEYTVVKKWNGLLFYPIFEPQSSHTESVEYASYEVIVPDSLGVRIKMLNVKEAQIVSPHRWEFRNMPAFEMEPCIPLGYSDLPRVMSAPTLFRMADFDGDMRNWQDFGKFINLLNRDRAMLDPETENKLRLLTADCPDMECKARKVYELLQSTTRYYFVGLGIGGWQPMPATDVDRFKYGDCKGLSNYTVAMLRAVGVPAYYALIRATEEEQKSQTPDFPNAWFNHATVCVPLPGDTIWLECTSPIESFGFLGTFTDNRPAMVAFPEGGRMIQTPRYDATINKTTREWSVSLAADGSAAIHTSDSYQGIAQEIRSLLSETDEKQRKEYLYNELNISDFEIKSLELIRKKERIPQVLESMILQVPQLAAQSGKRLFLPLDFAAGKTEIPVATAPRKSPVQADSRGYTKETTLRISIPEGYSLENEWSSISLHTDFGDFELNLEVQNQELVVRQHLVINDSIQPKEKYEELITFLQNIRKARQTKLVFVHQ